MIDHLNGKSYFALSSKAPRPAARAMLRFG